MSIIDVQGLCFDYPAPEEGKPPVTVLKNIDLQIEKGEFTAILGHNGSGKSTLAKHFNAILLPTSGKVTVCGIDTADEERVYDIRQRVGMVFQNPDNQLVATVVEEDVAFALENLGVPPAEMRTRVDEALKSVEMYEYRNHSPHQLSGGQKQRIAVAGVIAMRPECLVLDEPTAMLDPRGRKEIMKTLKTLHEDFGITVVLITHYMEEAAQAERVIVMDNGKIILDGTPKAVFSKVDLLKSVGLDVPQSTELAYELRKAGIDIPLDLLSEEDAANAVFALLEKGAKHESN